MIGPEPFIDAAVATLKAGLAAQIDSINAAHNDFDLPTVKPDRILFGGDDVDPIIEYPTVEVAVPDETISGVSLGQEDWDLSETIIVKAHLQNDVNVRGFQALYRACLRMRLALLGTLIVPNAFGDHSTVESVRSYYQANPMTGEKAEFVAAVTMQFTLGDFEVP